MVQQSPQRRRQQRHDNDDDDDNDQSHSCDIHDNNHNNHNNHHHPIKMTRKESDDPIETVVEHHHSLPIIQQPMESDDNDDESNHHDAHTEQNSSSKNLLTVWQAAALLTADCLGTGLLALPQDIHVLSFSHHNQQYSWFGLAFLIVLLPINGYAGTILSRAADTIEWNHHHHHHDDNSDCPIHQHTTTNNTATTSARDGILMISMPKNSIEQNNKRQQSYTTVQTCDLEVLDHGIIHQQSENTDETKKQVPVVNDEKECTQQPNNHPHHRQVSKKNKYHSLPMHVASNNEEDPNKDTISTTANDVSNTFWEEPSSTTTTTTMTHDYTSITQSIFGKHTVMTTLVTFIYYTNIFLVLGDYILVMAHAVQAFTGLCLPTAGILASTVMLGLSQLRTMNDLGHSVTALSLITLTIVVIQCLVGSSNNISDATTTNSGQQPNNHNLSESDDDDTTWIRKLSALASIGFATGPNKLILNIRYEMQHRSKAPLTLAIGIGIYGCVYVAICLLAGPDPPSFLFDSIPSGLSRKIAGVLLWLHVSVSYSINSQALCSSLDRRFVTRMPYFSSPARRWLILTFVLAVTSYLVANVVPFFKDLVALIGALTSVPLTMLLPVLLHRKLRNLPLFRPTPSSWDSYSLLLFSAVFLVIGLIGSLGSIELDWTQHRAPFACTVS